VTTPADAFDTGLIGADGAVLADPAGFLAAMPPAIRLVLAGCARADAVAFELADAGDGRLCPVAVAPLARSFGWRVALPASPVRGAIAVLRIAPAAVPERFARFGAAFGLSPALVRILAALYQHEDVARAAAAAGISFNTARDYLDQARRLIWAPNLPRLITWAAIGSLATDASAETDLPVSALFALSARQRRLAGAIADGASRAEAARTLAISDAVAKKELAAVYAATGVSSAIGLARLLAELRGLAIATGVPRLAEPHPPPFSRTLIVSRPGGRRVVASDYGPPAGRPVLVLHNTMNCRGVDRALVEALQNAGFRPVSPDRPGYGDTDPVPAAADAGTYLQACCDDLAALCAAQGWAGVPIIAHGPMQVVLALLQRAPPAFGRIVVDAPEPGAGHGASADGMIGTMKRQFARRPWAVAAAVRMLSTLASHARLAALMQDWTASSPADARAMADPALLMDFYRKLEPFRQGRIDGFVREQVVQATAAPPPALPGTRQLILLIGGTDFMHDAAQNRAYWQAVLPDARIQIIADAGRFISYSHPDQLVAALQD
jgi:DNA-binding CsgD family transcriptional regulator